MKIRFISEGSVPGDVLARNQLLLKDYPPPPRATTEKLAVVGGGHSAADHLESLRDFADIWAINNAWDWCRANGLDATLFTVDPLQFDPADKAILGNTCDPRLAEVCEEVCVFDLDAYAHGSTSATAAPHLAIELGYRQVHFYGCEGSFRETTHTFKDIGGNRLLVRANGGEYLTSSQMLMQGVTLAEMIRLAPHVFVEHCGGLLRALIADLDYDVLAGSKDIHEATMRARNGDQDNQ